MEDQTPFELNQAIRNWQECLRQSPHLREEDIIELETHARDSVAAFRAKGLTDEEAFLLATWRLGQPSQLEPEFSKVNRAEVWLNRLLWMLIGIQAWGLLSGLSGFAAHAVVVGGLGGLGLQAQSGPAGMDWGRAVLPVSLMSLAYLLVLAGILAGCWRIIHRNESQARHFLTRAVRRPVFLGVVVTFGFLVMYSLSSVESALIARHYSVTEVSTIYVYQMISRIALSLAQTLGFVGLTIALLRRRFRPLACAME
jgi:hypothetical protein